MILEKVHARGIDFMIRPGTSDLAAIKEVVERSAYTRSYFPIEPGERWLDLGANIGAFTCLACLHGAQVTAFEPEAENFDLLSQNARLNGFRPALIRSAVCAEAGVGRARLYLSNTNNGRWRHSLIRGKKKDSVEVQLQSIMPYLPEADAVKMDIEGSEIPILQAVEDWYNVRKLVFEWHFAIEPTYQVLRDVLDRLKRTFPYSSLRDYQYRKHEITHLKPTGALKFPDSVIIRVWR
jgi:FkbM family methyltransferase